MKGIQLRLFRHMDFTEGETSAYNDQLFIEQEGIFDTSNLQRQ
jgi:hypothetical protein